ncbi:MAG: hypothetical protein RLZ98_1272 [Pseudomonadota bacterium]|jgi:cation/acetate symporter
MSTITTQRQLVNPRLGNYFGVFASAFLALALLLLVFEQLGTDQAILRWAMLVGPLLLYIGIGVSCFATNGRDYFAAGRRVPASYAGLNLTASALGGTGLVAFTGLFFLNGYDAWCLSIGLTSGFVLMALLIAPYYRKFGAFTVPSFLGRRFESRIVRLTAAGLLAVPMLLILFAELRMALYAAQWLSGWNAMAVMMFILWPVIVLSILPGGVRSLAWTTTAQTMAAMIALLIPVCVVAALVTNLPLPQLSYGPVLRGIGRLEAAQGVPIPIAPLLSFDLAGLGLEPILGRMAEPYAKVGPLSFILASLSIMMGVAAAPWLLPRCTTTPGVYEARKSIGWAIFFTGVIMLTISAVAVFFRDMVMDDLVGADAGELPVWFKWMQDIGLAAVSGSGQNPPLTAFSFSRDAILFSMPVAAEFPSAFLYLSVAGALALALAATCATIVMLANIIAEDGIGGLTWEPQTDGIRIAIARITIAATAFLACWIALGVSADPVRLMLWALALSGSTAFPVLVLAIWWKRVSAFAALLGMVTGFVIAVLAILAGEAAWLGVPSAMAGVFGVPAGFFAILVATMLTPAPEGKAVERVRDMRLPGGEAVYDRELRLQRLKQQQGA